MQTMILVPVLLAFALAIMFLVRGAFSTAEQRAGVSHQVQGSSTRDSSSRWRGAVHTASDEPSTALPWGSPRRGDAELSPSLPADFVTQPTGAFRDVTGAFCFELHLVYGPAEAASAGEPILRLHERLSYWRVIGPTTNDSGHGGRAAWMTYARACELPGRRPTFEHFCSLYEMHDRLTALLAVGGITLTPLPDVGE